MKRFAFSIVAALSALTMTNTAAQAQNRAAPGTPPRTTTGLTEAGKLDAKTSGANIRASQIIGMSVYNTEGKSLGKINDLVLDASVGKVRYAAVSYGGFLGLGDKLFAIPWSAFKTQSTANGMENKLILNLNESQMKGATGFDQNNWPDFGDRTMTSKLDQYYGVRIDVDGVNASDRTGAGVGVNVNRDGVQLDLNRKREN